LGNNVLTHEIYDTINRAFFTYTSGVNNALAFGDSYLVNNRVTLADICFACEYALFSHERTRSAMLTGVEVQPITLDAAERFPKAVTHFENLCGNEAFGTDLAPFLSTDIFKTYFPI